MTIISEFFRVFYANSEDLGETPHIAASALGLHCLSSSFEATLDAMY